MIDAGSHWDVICSCCQMSEAVAVAVLELEAPSTLRL